MNRFVEALQVGLENAAQADANRAEITGVFSELSAAISEIDHRLNIELAEPEGSDLRNLPSNIPRRDLMKIVVKPKSGKARRIGFVSQSPSGYPCYLSLQGATVVAQDVVALQDVLSNAASSARIGQIISGMIREMDEKGSAILDDPE